MEIYQNLSLENLPNEEWRDVVGFEKSHEVSNLGRVRIKSQLKKWGNYIRKREAKIVSQYVKPNGYLSLHLSNDGVSKNAYVHRLVVEAFIRPMKQGEEVNHLDKNKRNNITSNLDICTRKENMAYSREDILSVVAKKVYRYTLEGEYDKEYSSVSDASFDNNVNASVIVYACKGGRNMANNHYFRYEKYDKIDIPYKKYKEVVITNTNGETIEFNSPQKAADFLGVKYNTIICSCVRGKKCKGYKLNYK